jgi:dienelactone hydrolase
LGGPGERGAGDGQELNGNAGLPQRNPEQPASGETDRGHARPGQPRPRPLSASVVVAASPAIREPRLDGERLFWLEQRPGEGGRTTLLMQAPGSPVQELTPGRNLRSRVHDYGGGCFTVAGPTLVFIDDGDRGLWRLDLPLCGADTSLKPAQQLTPPADPQRPRAFADGLIDQGSDRWIGVLEQDGRDLLVSVSLAGGEPQPLHAPADFIGYAVLSPSGSHLAWVEWQQPFMPWERSQLWMGRFDSLGQLSEVRRLAGSAATEPDGDGDGNGNGNGNSEAVSIFQPLWAGPDLVVANDRSGWWNLERLARAESLAAEAEPIWQPLLPMAAEFAMPQWVYGMRTTAWDGRQLLAAACREGCWELGRLVPDPGGEPPMTWQSLGLPFNDLAALDAAAGRLVALAAAPDRGPGLLDLDTASGRWQHRPAAADPLEPDSISQPQELWFAGHGDLRTQAWFYPPAGGAHPEAPLLVRGHSGPTAMARTGLNLSIQFWTSRGWGVVDVNYGGSTGFGRAYRERLKGQWGVVDVADCIAAARALVASGQASAGRIAMEGGSAAGFTVLAALGHDDTIRAGACRYPVTDLAALAGAEHRFEARYFDGLIGPWPAARATYEARSPLKQAARIRRPVILFHGLDDRVVPPEQSERLALALSEQGVPVELHLFPGEGHGFRSGAVQQQVIEATEAFFRRYLLSDQDQSDPDRRDHGKRDQPRNTADQRKAGPLDRSRPDGSPQQGGQP